MQNASDRAFRIKPGDRTEIHWIRAKAWWLSDPARVAPGGDGHFRVALAVGPDPRGPNGGHMGNLAAGNEFVTGMVETSGGRPPQWFDRYAAAVAERCEAAARSGRPEIVDLRSTRAACREAALQEGEEKRRATRIADLVRGAPTPTRAESEGHRH